MLLNELVILAFSAGLAKALPHIEERGSKETLKWGSCDDFGFPASWNLSSLPPRYCATLQVPLDYTNPKSESLKLQLVKIKATKKPYKGSVLMNPGGPGSSGIETVATDGDGYLEAMGGQFDFIGFDPRGTGRTIPFHCESNTTTTSDTTTKATLSRRANITVKMTEADNYEKLKESWDSNKNASETCYKVHKKTGRFISTAFVARDMLRIVDALNEGGLLNYWGVSYGTLLGQTFAAMFPDRVGRMLLDGNVIPLEYYSGYYFSDTRDTSKALYNVFRECINAGPQRCALANITGSATTPELLSAAFADALQSLLDTRKQEDYEIYEKVKSYLFKPTYSPSAKWKDVVAIVMASIQGQWTALSKVIDAVNAAGKSSTTTDDVWEKGTSAISGIRCSDSNFRANSPEDMYAYVQAQASQGDWTDVTMGAWECAQWKFDAAERPNSTFRNLNTSFPLMFVNSPYDPITPLSGAYEASVGFKRSRVLVHNGHGHGVLSHPSNCTNKAIAKYFVNGTLPKPGDKCEPNVPAWKLVWGQ